LRQAARRPLRRTLGLTKASGACGKLSSSVPAASVHSLLSFTILEAFGRCSGSLLSREFVSSRPVRLKCKIPCTVGADSPPGGGRILVGGSSLWARVSLRVLLSWPAAIQRSALAPFKPMSKSSLFAVQAVRCSASNTVSPNPSVKGTGLRPAPYVER